MRGIVDYRLQNHKEDRVSERVLPSSNEMKRRKIAILNFLLADVLNVLPSSVRRGLVSTGYLLVLISHLATVVCIVKDRNAEKDSKLLSSFDVVILSPARNFRQ